MLDVLAVKYESRKLPGRFQVANKQITIWNWQETESLPMEDNFAAVLENWRRIKLAFVLVTAWRGATTAKRGKCIRCLKPGLHLDSSKFKTWSALNLAKKKLSTTIPELIPNF